MTKCLTCNDIPREYRCDVCDPLTEGEQELMDLNTTLNLCLTIAIKAMGEAVADPTPYQCGHQRTTTGHETWTRQAEEKENGLHKAMTKIGKLLKQGGSDAN